MSTQTQGAYSATSFGDRIAIADSVFALLERDHEWGADTLAALAEIFAIRGVRFEEPATDRYPMDQCAECGWLVPTDKNIVSPAHATLCSLHPSNVQTVRPR